MTPIKDRTIYVSGMSKSMEDKCFWFDKIPRDAYSTVTDYGCADGTFLQKVREYNPNCFICGIDIDDWMLQRAEEKFDYKARFINEAFLDKPIHTQGDVLNLSSVIHEIYSYKSPQEIDNFWNYVKGHKYVCIRDMCINNTIKHKLSPGLPYIGEEEALRRSEFESLWGPIEYLGNYVHYLLKYRYIVNWDREVKENYLPMSRGALQYTAQTLGYSIIFDEHYTLPFLKEKIKEDWNIDFDIPTHIKMIWKRKE